MRCLALATDYDGTLAEEGHVRKTAVRALHALKRSGRKLILVTGRELDELHAVFPELGVFDRVVAENGALLYSPAREAERNLAERPPDGFVEALRRLGVTPLSVGRVIVATREPCQDEVLAVLREQALDLKLIFNKGAVMVLPPGVSKRSGLAAALEELGVSPGNVVGIGDAENDLDLIEYCGCGVAVATALEPLKRAADLVTRGGEGQGVVELIDLILGDGLRGCGDAEQGMRIAPS